MYLLLRCLKPCSGWSKKVKMLMKDNIVSLFKHLENNRITFPWRQDRWILDIDIYDTDKGNYSPRSCWGLSPPGIRQSVLPSHIWEVKHFTSCTKTNRRHLHLVKMLTWLLVINCIFRLGRRIQSQMFCLCFSWVDLPILPTEGNEV